VAEIIDRPSLLCKVSTMRLIPGFVGGNQPSLRQLSRWP